MSAIAEPESADSSDRAESATAVQGEATTADIPDRGSGWILLLAALPAVVIGMAIRAWLPRTPMLVINADEAVTGLQAFGVLHGRFSLVVGGNQYGSTTEAYLLAPILAVWTGVWPLRIMCVLLSAVAALALFLLARPFFGRAIAVVLALIGWTMSGAVVIMWTRPYMGYTSGFIAQVAALALACRAMRTDRKLGRTALGAGFATGFALWSHPIFGAVAMIAVATTSIYRFRYLRSWWLPLAAGGILGVSPWLVSLVGSGWPQTPGALSDATYFERIENFFTELLPRAFGVRALDSVWLGSPLLAGGLAAALIVGSLGGLVLLVVRKGLPAIPVLTTGLLIFPVLAIFPPLSDYADARYSLPFLPQLLMGLGAWLLLLPARARTSPWLVAVLPTVWALAFALPQLHQSVGWTVSDPDAPPSSVVRELDSRGIRYLGGNYWGVYVVDYFADGRLIVKPDIGVRLTEDAEEFAQADPAAIAYLYGAGEPPNLSLPTDRYDRLTIDGYDLYLPRKETG